MCGAAGIAGILRSGDRPAGLGAKRPNIWLGNLARQFGQKKREPRTTLSIIRVHLLNTIYIDRGVGSNPLF